ncbi:MAG: hypothetical protein U0271_17665 [Polyangiaceae bacterium]
MRVLWALILMSPIACGDSDGAGATSNGGAGGVGASGGAGAGGGAGGSACTPLELGAIRGYGPDTYGTNEVAPELGEPLLDGLRLVFYGNVPLSGEIDLGAGDNANFKTCSSCLLLAEDVGADGVPAKYYFQSRGTLDLGAATLTPGVDPETVLITGGGLAAVELVEVDIDPTTSESTPVPNGRCLTIEQIPIDMTPAPAGWTCDVGFYGDESRCDCECGLADPDCDDTALPIVNCTDGQSCTNGVCG